MTPDVYLIGPEGPETAHALVLLRQKNPYLNIIVVDHLPTGSMLPTLEMSEVVRAIQLQPVFDGPVPEERRDHDRSQWKHRSKRHGR